MMMGDLDEALKYQQEAEKLYEASADKDGRSVTFNNLGFINIRMHKQPEAEKNFNDGLKLALEIGNKKDIKTSYEGLTEVDSLKGDFKKMLFDYKMFIAYSDSLVNETNTKKSLQLSMQYEFDKKQAADSIKNEEFIKQESLKHEQEIAQQKTYAYGGAAGFMLMLIVAGVSFRAFRQKQKTNTIISHQKELVEEKQKEILDSIYYARRIQRSLLPTEKYIGKSLIRLNKK